MHATVPRAYPPTHPPTHPVQDLPGVFSAREFVWWYNGHPQYRDLPVDLSATRSVAIAGLGNVAGAEGRGWRLILV